MRILITGGAGFIGCNTAADFISRGDEVIIFDNLSRPGTEDNLAWVRSLGKVEFIQADIRDARAVRRALQESGELDAVLHLAAQVAVTTSVVDPRSDFEVNALGTLNVLEAVRGCRRPPVLLYASTNKVYGALEDVEVMAAGTRYESSISATGIDERRRLDFHSPYGCSKGAADQYVRDYARIYQLSTVVLRQSCIYGHRQFGIEDQGWLAWFTLAAHLDRPVTVFGDGRQVRDVLEISDLVRLYRLCLERIERVRGAVLNVGGGPDNTISINESLQRLERALGRPLVRRQADWRHGDQRIFVASVKEAERRLGWRPQVGIEEGLAGLIDWVGANLGRIGLLAS